MLVIESAYGRPHRASATRCHRDGSPASGRPASVGGGRVAFGGSAPAGRFPPSGLCLEPTPTPRESGLAPPPPSGTPTQAGAAAVGSTPAPAGAGGRDLWVRFPHLDHAAGGRSDLAPLPGTLRSRSCLPPVASLRVELAEARAPSPRARRSRHPALGRAHLAAPKKTPKD